MYVHIWTSCSSHGVPTTPPWAYSEAKKLGQSINDFDPRCSYIYIYAFKHWITLKKGATTIFVVKRFMKASHTFDRLRFSSIGEQKKFL